MLATPKISIITVCLDAQKHLESCIDSIRSQRFIDFEHIVIDGGSTDETVEILRTKGGAKTRWISEPDNGIAEAMNKGIAMAKGEWLLFLQADDWLDGPDSLLRASAHLEPAYDLVLFDTRVHRSDMPPRVWSVNIGRFWRKMPGSHQGMFFRRSSFLRFGGYDTSYRIAMDYDFVYRMLRSKANAGTVHEVISNVSEAGLSGQTHWPAQRRRFLEERRVHFSNARNFLGKGRTLAYWSFYYPYRRLLNLVFRSSRAPT